MSSSAVPAGGDAAPQGVTDNPEANQENGGLRNKSDVQQAVKEVQTFNYGVQSLIK